ncbi:MAG: hypothetical protein WA954_01375 [Parerythrobacter sp.]
MSDELVPEMFDRWQKGTGHIFQELERLKALVDPFHLGETAGVSILAAGAARVGFTPVTEVVLRKSKIDQLGNGLSWNGRNDLMISAEGANYMFEFKLCWQDASDKQIEECLVLASDDAACLPSNLCTGRYGGIVSSYTCEAAQNRYRNFEKAADKIIVSNDGASEGLAFLFRKVAS